VLLFLSGILIVASYILKGVDSLEDVGRGKDEGDLDSSERVQKRIAHWDKQNYAVPAPNCMLKVQGEIIKDEGL